MDINEALVVTANDIQCKKTAGESCDNRVRKSWVLQMDEESKQKFAHFPGYVRQQLYQQFDKEILGQWILNMRKARLGAIDEGAEMIKIAGDWGSEWRLEDEFCSNTDDILLATALAWLEDFKTRDAKSA